LGGIKILKLVNQKVTEPFLVTESASGKRLKETGGFFNEVVKVKSVLAFKLRLVPAVNKFQPIVAQLPGKFVFGAGDAFSDQSERITDFIKVAVFQDLFDELNSVILVKNTESACPAEVFGFFAHYSRSERVKSAYKRKSVFFLVGGTHGIRPALHLFRRCIGK
jgi:hypothetical protein